MDQITVLYHIRDGNAAHVLKFIKVNLHYRRTDFLCGKVFLLQEGTQDGGRGRKDTKRPKTNTLRGEGTG
eukprot:11532223-Karenia_brevis.AAC.1